MAIYDLVIGNGTLVLPYQGTVQADLGVRNGKIAAIAENIPAADGETFIDARGKAVFPGGVDAHFHIGIYNPIVDDAENETRSALVGGVSTILSYFRTGQHYLNRSGPYREIFPDVLRAVAGHCYTDYAFHLAIMTSAQLDEIDWLVREQGVTSFKYYMFYKGLNLAADSTDAQSYTMADSYDLGHLFAMMERIAAAGEGITGRVSLSIHCENAELIKLFIQRVSATGAQTLKAYSDARPPLTEQLSIAEAMTLANATRCPVNLLHLSSTDALDEAVHYRRRFGLDQRLETTIHHLSLTYDTAAGGLNGKVNPPIRSANDVEALWRGVLAGEIDWVASDHACCLEREKRKGIWSSLPGFGGTSLLYPVLLSEGYHKRGLPLQRVAELAAANPARAYGLYPSKGCIIVGADADLAIVDLDEERTVTAAMLLSGQEYTPFEGMRVKGWPTHTIVRGRLVFANGAPIGAPGGEFLRRPAVAERVETSASPR